MNSTGSSNTVIGYAALYAKKTGSKIIALGEAALRVNKNGTTNIAVGFQAALNPTTAAAISAAAIPALWH